jgi:flagellar motor switch protein FliG
MSVQVVMSGARKAAILLLTLGEKEFERGVQAPQRRRSGAHRPGTRALGTVAADTGERILDEFHQLASSASYANLGGVSFAKRLLERARGSEASKRILEQLTTKVRRTVGFTSLERADPQQLSKFILAEHPQTIALILSHLHANSAAQLVSLLPEELRADVLTRMARLDEISPEVIAQISTLIDQRLRALGGQREQHGGVRAVAELFNRLDRSFSQSVLETIETDRRISRVDPHLMFVFDDLRHLEDTGPARSDSAGRTRSC